MLPLRFSGNAYFSAFDINSFKINPHGTAIIKLANKYNIVAALKSKSSISLSSLLGFGENI